MSAPTLFFLDAGLDNMTAPFRSGKVMSISPGQSPRVLVEHQKLPDGIGILENRIYWTNMGTPGKHDGSVKSSRHDGSDMQTIVPEGAVHTPKQIVVEPRARKLYFCDREGLRICKCSLDGSHLETLIETGRAIDMADQRNWPVGITLDTDRQMIYWSQKGPSKGSQGRIFRAGLHLPAGQTAAQRTDIECLFEKLPEPIDLEYDEQTRTLYWTDRGNPPFGSSLNRCCVDSIETTRSPGAGYVIMKKLCEPIGLKLDKRNSHVYVADLSGRIYRCNEDGSEKQVILESPVEGVFTGVTLHCEGSPKRGLRSCL